MDERSLGVELRLVLTPLLRALREQTAPGELSNQLQSALSALLRCGPLTLSQLARTERVTQAVVTGVAAALEREGYVTRAVDDRDRRVSRLTITPHGEVALESIRTRRDEWLAGRIASLDSDDRALLERSIDVLRSITDESAADEPDARVTIRGESR